MSFVTAVVTEIVHHELPLPLLTYPGVAAAVFLALGLVVWSFRDVANRHSAKADAYAAAHGGAPTAGGH